VKTNNEAAKRLCHSLITADSERAAIDLLEGFISKRGRPFSAYLKFKDGKVGFEFPERTTAVSESKQTS
jgi:hypothetical protein